MLRFPTSRYLVSSSSTKTRLTASVILPFCNSIRRYQSQNNNNNNNDDDGDDFVADSAFLQQNETNNTNELTIQQPLGIERQPHIQEGTRFSRLNNVVTSQPAPNVPTQRQVSREEAGAAEISKLLGREETLKKLGEEGKSYTLLNDDNESDAKVVEEGKESSSLEEQNEHYFEEVFSGEELPYDDANYAETILKMEVEGAIDETWQDTIQAKPEDVAEIVEVLKDSRCRDIVAIDVRTKTSNFDFVVVATCESQRHMTLASWAVSEADKWNRVAKPSRRKADELWDVVPVGRILVNVMVESYRNEVSVERKWAVTKSMDPLDAAHTRVSESRQVRMHGLWTLTMNLQDLEDFEIDYCKDILLSQL